MYWTSEWDTTTDSHSAVPNPAELDSEDIWQSSSNSRAASMFLPSASPLMLYLFLLTHRHPSKLLWPLASGAHTSSQAATKHSRDQPDNVWYCLGLGKCSRCSFSLLWTVGEKQSLKTGVKHWLHRETHYLLWVPCTLAGFLKPYMCIDKNVLFFFLTYFNGWT